MKMCKNHEYVEKHNGLQKLCLVCYREYNANYHKKLRKELSEQVNEFKLKSGCKKCGYKENVFALQIDHIVPISEKINKKRGVRNKKEFSKSPLLSLVLI
jgi:5-methylcytosine-specific restriction endonuclease McrA